MDAALRRVLYAFHVVKLARRSLTGATGGRKLDHSFLKIIGKAYELIES